MRRETFFEEKVFLSRSVRENACSVYSLAQWQKKSRTIRGEEKCNEWREKCFSCYRYLRRFLLKHRRLLFPPLVFFLPTVPIVCLHFIRRSFNRFSRRWTVSTCVLKKPSIFLCLFYALTDIALYLNKYRSLWTEKFRVDRKFSFIIFAWNFCIVLYHRLQVKWYFFHRMKQLLLKL